MTEFVFARGRMDTDAALAAADTAAEAWDALDEFLRRGGFLPADWRNDRTW